MKHSSKSAILVTDLGFGDSGKGSIVDYLTRKTGAPLVVRSNGGAQAAHRVITPEGKDHVFAQFGSGTFNPWSRTFLSKYVLVEPYALLYEEAHLRHLGVPDAFDRLYIDKKAPVITTIHRSATRLREIARGVARHGSCGVGIAETMRDLLTYGDDTLFVGDLANKKLTYEKLEFLRTKKLAELAELLESIPLSDIVRHELMILQSQELTASATDEYAYAASHASIVDGDWLSEQLRIPGAVIFEGAQGVLLDEWYGFHPYTTWSTCTSANAQTLLTEAGYDGDITILGLLRTYMTRHGPGPFVTEDRELTSLLPDEENIEGAWQGSWRVGYLDIVALRYALEVMGRVDQLVVSHLDRLPILPSWKIATAYETREGQRLQELPTIGEPDLEFQEQLTNILLGCTPVYQELPMGRTNEYIDAIESLCGVPVGIISTGPTANQKQLLSRSVSR